MNALPRATAASAATAVTQTRLLTAIQRMPSGSGMVPWELKIRRVVVPATVRAKSTPRTAPRFLSAKAVATISPMGGLDQPLADR